MIDYRAPRVTTYATARGTLHAIDTGRPANFANGRHAFGAVCGASLSGGIMMRSSATADAYVTCKRCAARLAAGVTVSERTIRAARLRSQLVDPQNH